MFSKKLIDKIERDPKLKELDRGLGTFMLSQGFKRVRNKDGSAKLVKMNREEERCAIAVADSLSVKNSLKQKRKKAEG